MAAVRVSWEPHDVRWVVIDGRLRPALAHVETPREPLPPAEDTPQEAEDA